MSCTLTVSYTITCNRCQTPAQIHENAGAYHWPTRAQAIAELSTSAWGWESGPGEQTCPTCCRVRECQNLGHDWQSWASLATVGRPDLLERACDRCGLDEICDDPVSGLYEEVEA